MTPKVSVNIACYNHEKFIGEAIQSVLNQTFQDFELIICDNGSTDNSLQIIKSFDDPRIKVESIFPNRQSTFAGNNCIKRGCGEYIALLCSDDAWEPTKLEKQVKYLDEHPETGVVFTRVLPILPDGTPEKALNNFYHWHFNIEKNRSSMEWLHDMWERADHSFCCSSACLRRKCIDEFGMLDIRAKYIQDFILWADILTKYEAYILEGRLTKMRYFPNKDNLSAISTKVLVASYNEMPLLFEKFKKIKTIDKFLEFLPETKDKFAILEDKYIPFYLSILTLNLPKYINFQQTALAYLYEIMADTQMRKELEEKFNFTYMDLYDYAAKTDTYKSEVAKKETIYFRLKLIFNMIKMSIS